MTSDLAAKHVRQRVLSFVARIFVDAARRPRHRQFTLEYREQAFRAQRIDSCVRLTRIKG